MGFTTADRITYGAEAFMHLHLIDESRRAAGFGARFVALSVPRYFEALELGRLLCEPNALNIAPNRTLQRAGFRYEMSHHTTPGPLNPPQVVTRWRFDRDWLGEPAGTVRRCRGGQPVLLTAFRPTPRSGRKTTA